MDAWDVVSALVRRWYLVLAILLVGVVAAAGVYSQLPRSYQATDAQLLVGPPDQEAAELNPLTSGPTAAGVISVLTRSEEFGQAIADGGGAPDYAVSPSDQSGLVGLQAQAKEGAQAALTVSLLADEVLAGLVRAQDDLGVPEASRLRLLPVTSTPEVTESSGSAQTAAFVVFALAVLAAVVLAVGIDSRARRRHRGSGSGGSDAAVQQDQQADGDRLRAVEAGLDAVHAGLALISTPEEPRRSGVPDAGAATGDAQLRDRPSASVRSDSAGRRGKRPANGDLSRGPASKHASRSPLPSNDAGDRIGVET